MTAVPLARAALQLRPRQLRVITLKRSLPGPDLEVRSVRVLNTTGEWLYCRFASTLPWVHPDRHVGWIEPHGVLEMAVRVARHDGARREPRGGLEIHAGGYRWQLPVRRHQRGASWPLLVLWQGAGALALASLIAAVWTVILVVSMSHGALAALLVCLAALLAVCARVYRVRRF